MSARPKLVKFTAPEDRLTADEDRLIDAWRALTPLEQETYLFEMRLDAARNIQHRLAAGKQKRGGK